MLLMLAPDLYVTSKARDRDKRHPSARPAAARRTLWRFHLRASSHRAARRQGIIHRDLKSGDVMLTKTGARLLDFGRAKLKAEAADSASFSTPSTEEPATAPGAILGTVPYMAPKQLDGKPCDPRCVDSTSLTLQRSGDIMLN